jgi:hypothetical protein
MDEQRYTRDDAEVEEIVRVLRSYDCLTRHNLLEFVAGDHWPDHQFEAALKRGVRAGRIRKLADDLYELGESER